MKLADLRRAGRSPGLPLRLSLPEGELELQQWLRVLPNRRYVARAAWRGRRVLAKLLVGSRAERHYRREARGAGWLAARGLDTPLLLASGYRSEAGGWLLFEYLENAESLGCRWQAIADQPPLSGAQEGILGSALEALGVMHAKGLWQEDLHLDNLLCKNGKLFWVDTGSVRSAARDRTIGTAQALTNLGIFFAQLPETVEAFVPKLLEHYRRGNSQANLPFAALRQQIAKARQRRLDNFIGKLGRDCSQFSVCSGPMGMQAVVRSEVQALHSLLVDPDSFISQGEILKTGGASTVARVVVNGRTLLVKRYNIKGFSHWLRRCWRPSRAWRSWREGHRLKFLGMATAQPLAMLEHRCCWLRGRAYLVTEFLGGENILTRFAPYVQGSLPPDELAAVADMFASLNRASISHGDMKGDNLFWHGGRWALVDLDATRQHRRRRSFLRALARDRERFLKNWSASSELFRQLEERIPAVPDTFHTLQG